jgi:hypothetical protein
VPAWGCDRAGAGQPHDQNLASNPAPLDTIGAPEDLDVSLSDPRSGVERDAGIVDQDVELRVHLDFGLDPVTAARLRV